MSENCVENWYTENRFWLMTRARKKGIKPAEEAEDLTQDVAVAVLEAIAKGTIIHKDKLQNYGNAVLTNLINDRIGRRFNQLLKAPSQGESSEIPEKAAGEADLDEVLAAADPISVAAALIDIATPTHRKAIISTLLHWGRREGMASTLGVSRQHLREEDRRLKKWLANTIKGSYREFDRLLSHIRPTLDQAIEKCVRILNGLTLDDPGSVKVAGREWRGVVADAAALLRVSPRSVQLAMDIFRFVSPSPQDLSAGHISFLLDGDRDNDRFEHPVLRDARDKFITADSLTLEGEISRSVRCHASAWQRASDFKPCDDIERLAIGCLRREALVRVVWPVANGEVLEESLAPLMN